MLGGDTVDCRRRKRRKGLKVEAYVWNKTGEEVKAQCANRPAGEVTKKICHK